VIYVALNVNSDEALAQLSTLLAALSQSALVSSRAIVVGFQVYALSIVFKSATVVCKANVVVVVVVDW
jgi:hypothetical protein